MFTRALNENVIEWRVCLEASLLGVESKKGTKGPEWNICVCKHIGWMSASLRRGFDEGTAFPMRHKAKEQRPEQKIVRLRTRHFGVGVGTNGRTIARRRNNTTELEK